MTKNISQEDRQKIQHCMDKKQKFFMKAFEALQKNENSIPYWNLEMSFITEITKILGKYEPAKIQTDNINVDESIYEDVKTEDEEDTTI